jgi:glutathione-regulated potassium-efflux system ancillary protein KefG
MGRTSRVTIFFFHPFTRRSETNRTLLQAAKQIPGVQIRDMYELYPDFGIDVDLEQQVLMETDVAVFQHPFYWYNCPALMKEWLDAVLEYGWAYGTGGDKLQGKRWLQVISTGGPEAAYSRDGYNEFTVHELLRPFERTARLCGMSIHLPFLVQGAFTLTDEKRSVHAKKYAQLLEAAVRGEMPPELSTR